MSLGLKIAVAFTVATWLFAAANIVFFVIGAGWLSLVAGLACVGLAAFQTFVNLDTYRMERGR